MALERPIQRGVPSSRRRNHKLSIAFHKEITMKLHLAAALVLMQVVSGYAQQVFDTNTKQRIRVVPIATGLVHPWSIAFLPDGHTMLVAERAGRLRAIRDGVLDPQSVWTAPAPPKEGSDNLHSVVVHPQFEQNHFIYVS